MSRVRDDGLHAHTKTDIGYQRAAGHGCSCEHRDGERGGWWYLCEYHDGFDSACWIMEAEEQ